MQSTSYLLIKALYNLTSKKKYALLAYIIFIFPNLNDITQECWENLTLGGIHQKLLYLIGDFNGYSEEQVVLNLKELALDRHNS